MASDHSEQRPGNGKNRQLQIMPHRQEVVFGQKGMQQFHPQFDPVEHQKLRQFEKLLLSRGKPI